MRKIFFVLLVMVAARCYRSERVLTTRFDVKGCGGEGLGGVDYAGGVYVESLVVGRRWAGEYRGFGSPSEAETQA